MKFYILLLLGINPQDFINKIYRLKKNLCFKALFTDIIIKIKLLVVIIKYIPKMSKNLRIRPFLWSAIFFAIVGSLISGFMAIRAVDSLATNSAKMAEFERDWSNANMQDARASDAAKYFIATGQLDAKNIFSTLNEKRSQLLLSAMDNAPKISDNKILTRTYDATIAMADIESAAVLLAANSDSIGAKVMLSSPRYAQLGTTKSLLKERARGQLIASIRTNVLKANDILIFGLGGLFLSLVIAAYCWWKVGKIFQLQAHELEVARDALAVHANQLEARIEIRTRDLESAKTAAEAADKAKSAFLAQMSHEIRTPLNGVLGMAAALARTNLDERQQRLLAVVQESGDTLLALLNDVLDLAKIEAGKLEIEAVDFNVAQIVRSAEAIFSTRAHDKGLSFSVSIDESADIWCIGDPTRLRQILYNLMSNAIKFTNEGDIKVNVNGLMLENHEVELKFMVQDSGVGINEEGLSRLFQRFSQADSATTRKFGGTGLGLAICKELAQLMGGDISVTSEVDKGSCFTLTLRSILGQAPVETDAETFERSFENDGSGAGDLKILAAEDNSNNRLVLKMLLEQVGITPTFVENGALAVEAWKNNNYDVILMDVQMPIMSGPEAASMIRSIEEQNKRSRTPIIALTANAMTHHVRECLASGMDCHVAKPIRPDLLFAAIDEVLADDDEFEAVQSA